MSRLKERTHRAHVPAQRAQEPAVPVAAPAGPAPAGVPAEHATPRHRVVVAAVAAALAATAVIWGASSLADGTTEPTAPGIETPFQFRPMAGGVPFGP